MEKEMTIAKKLAAATLIALVLAPSIAHAFDFVDTTPGPRTISVVEQDQPNFDFADRSHPTIDAPLLGIGGNGNRPYVDVGLGDKPNVPYYDLGLGDKGKPGAPTKPGMGKKSGQSARALDVAIACKVAGTPTEFPDDLVLTNYGQPLAAGTTIKWKVKSAGHGHIQLAKDLPTGGSAKASGVLAGGVEAGKPCTAKLV
jgi:hypothetical protein